MKPVVALACPRRTMAEWFSDVDAADVVVLSRYNSEDEVGHALAWFTANPDVWQVDCRGVVGDELWFGVWTRRGWLHEMGAP